MKYVASLDNEESPLRVALRAYCLGVKDIIEDRVSELNSPDLFLSPKRINNSTWQQDEMHVLCLDSPCPTHCVTASYMSQGYHVTYLCPRTKAQLGLPEDHGGKLTHSQYCDIGVRRFSDKELHALMGFSRRIYWSGTRKQYSRQRALGNAVVPKVVAPLMASMFSALGFSDSPAFRADTNCLQVGHSTVQKKGVTIHTFLPDPQLGLGNGLAWPELQQGVQVAVFWPQYNEEYAGEISKRSIVGFQGAENVIVEVWYPDSDTWASHKLPVSGRWLIRVLAEEAASRLQ